MENKQIKENVRELLAQMTLEEKLAQLAMDDCRKLFEDGVLNTEKAKEWFGTVGVGALQIPQLPPEETADWVNQVHSFLKETMRLQIPPFMISEALHGVMLPEATVFPQSIAMGGTWNDELMGRVATAIGKEAAACGITQTLCPDLDLCRDPRWGRIEETYGEDAHLTSKLGTAYVNGMQGGDEVDDEHVAVTLKHFAVHGMPENGINLSPTVAGERLIQEYYLAPFRNVIRDTNPISVMPAYTEIDGIPCSSSRRLLTDILRDDLGFTGYTISDFGAMDMLIDFHYTADGKADAGRQCLHAGMDMEAPQRDIYGKEFEELVRTGEVPMEEIDLAVERILEAKFRARLFEKTEFDPKKAKELFNCPEHQKLAFEAATESVILLENRNNILPLKNVRSIAVVGPNADAWQLGDYTLDRTCKTPLQAIKERAGEDVEVRYAKGCDLWSQNDSGIEAAVEAVRQSEIAVLCVGGCSTVDYGVGWGVDRGLVRTCGEGFDLSDLGLQGKQQQLAEAVINTGVPTIVVHVDGRPASIPWIAKNCAALLETWYGGQEASNALAAVLFGDVNPSGKLPVSVAESVGQAPAYYNHQPSARGSLYRKHGSLEKPGRDYVFSGPEPLYPFGYGLSYTTFAYSDLHAEYDAGAEEVKVTVNVKNTGDVAGKEVVQLYFRDVIASAARPVRELKGFSKILLAPGETQTVSFTVPKKDLAFLNEKYEWIVEPGTFRVFVGDQVTEFVL